MAPWIQNPLDASQGTDVGSANSQDEFYGYGEGLMNPDQIVIDMKERIHMISADASPFYSWMSMVRKNPCHNTNFSWIEDEIFGHRDFSAQLRQRETDPASGVYIYTLRIRNQGDWQALEAASQADGWDAERPIIRVDVHNAAKDAVLQFAPLVMGLAEGRKNRQYVCADGNTLQLMNEIVLCDSSGPAAVVGGIGARPEVADVDNADDIETAYATLIGGGDDVDIEVFCHTDTPNTMLQGFPQGSGLPNETRKRSRSFHNFTQIFKTPLSIANTLKHIRLYGGPELARQRMRKAAQHKVDLEYALLFQGGGIEGVHWGEIPVWGAENPLTRFKGLGIGAANANLGGSPDRVGCIYSKNADLDARFQLDPTTADLQAVNQLCADVFDDVIDNPSSVKVAFASQRWFLALSQMAMNAAAADSNPFFGWRTLPAGSNSIGIRVNELETPSGTLRFVRMPHFRGRYEDYALVVDMKNLEVRPLQGRDTKFFSDVGNKDIDGQLDYFLTETGFECRHESTHAILRLV